MLVYGALIAIDLWANTARFFTNGLGNLGKVLRRVGGERGSRILGKGVLSQWSRLIKDVSYEQCMWIKVKGENGRNTLFLGCVYMPTDSESVSVIESSYEELKEDVLRMKERLI